MHILGGYTNEQIMEEIQYRAKYDEWPIERVYTLMIINTTHPEKSSADVYANLQDAIDKLDELYNHDVNQPKLYENVKYISNGRYEYDLDGDHCVVRIVDSDVWRKLD